MAKAVEWTATYQQEWEDKGGGRRNRRKRSNPEDVGVETPESASGHNSVWESRQRTTL